MGGRYAVAGEAVYTTEETALMVALTGQAMRPTTQGAVRPHDIGLSQAAHVVVY